MTSRSDIKPIQTRYAGCHFRSRLEARWAVFFDEAGIDWQYEPEGFEISYEEEEGGPSIVQERYLPDFYLPKSETWVEVKGSDELLAADAERLEMMLDWSSPIPGVNGSYDDKLEPWTKTCHGLLILGDIPRIMPGVWGPVLHPLIQHHEGLCWVWAMFHAKVGPRRCYGNMLTYVVMDDEPDQWTTGAVMTNTGLWNREIAAAYTAARSARFEHGENGTS